MAGNDPRCKKSGQRVIHPLWATVFQNRRIGNFRRKLVIKFLVVAQNFKTNFLQKIKISHSAILKNREWAWLKLR